MIFDGSIEASMRLSAGPLKSYKAAETPVVDEALMLQPIG